jgi:hypothetical protein
VVFDGVGIAFFTFFAFAFTAAVATVASVVSGSVSGRVSGRGRGRGRGCAVPSAVPSAFPSAVPSAVPLRAPRREFSPHFARFQTVFNDFDRHCARFRPRAGQKPRGHGHRWTSREPTSGRRQGVDKVRLFHLFLFLGPVIFFILVLPHALPFC